MSQDIIIHGGNFQQFISPVVDGEKKSHGLIPRDYSKQPVGCYKSAPPLEAVDFPLIPRSEWPARIKDMEAEKSRISDIMLAQGVPCLDQNGKGYCWAHSTTGAVMALRAIMNEPTVELSAYAVACIIKHFADEGGWGALSLDFITSRGVPSSAFWPQRSMDRGNDNAATWANAALHRTTEGWADLAISEYDRTLSFDQEGSLLLSRVPVVKDENWWSHSILGCDLVDGSAQRSVTRTESGKLVTLSEFEAMWGLNNTVTAGFGVRIRNSWGSSWGTNGFGVLTGSQAISDGAVAPRVTMASAA